VGIFGVLFVGFCLQGSTSRVCLWRYVCGFRVQCFAQFCLWVSVRGALFADSGFCLQGSVSGVLFLGLFVRFVWGPLFAGF
jgi:hypothetical protein